MVFANVSLDFFRMARNNVKVSIYLFLNYKIVITAVLLVKMN